LSFKVCDDDATADENWRLEDAARRCDVDKRRRGCEGRSIADAPARATDKAIVL
jgi:hypothetical protein